MGNGWRLSGMASSGTGGMYSADGANEAASRGNAWSNWYAGGFRASASCILIRANAMTPPIQGKSRMREIRPYGSVRGVRGDSHPYRDSQEPAAARVFSSSMEG